MLSAQTFGSLCRCSEARTSKHLNLCAPFLVMETVLLNGRFLARVTAYKNIIVIEGVGLDFVHEKWVPAGGGKIGCVVGDTKNLLGVSKEAARLLKSVRRGQDAIGDVMWFKANDGLDYFGWLGSNLRLVDPDDAEADRDFQILEYVTIPNRVPAGARAAIDEEVEDVPLTKPSV